jgi:hypothetical protein
MFGNQDFRVGTQVVKTTVAMVFCTLVAAASAVAKPLYVDGNSGNDSVTYAQNGPANPWRSIGRALWGSTNRSSPNANEAARAGDVVHITCGVYDTTGPNANGFIGIALSPVNNGTAAQPIRIQSVNNQFACIRVRFTSGSGSIIGSANKSYIQWSGFDLNEVDAPWSSAHGHQSAPYWLSGDEQGTNAVGNVIENSRFEGTVTSARDGDNYTMIRLHGNSGTTIRNVHIRNVGQTDENSGCILWYYTKNITIENSQLENCGSGIYMKGDALPTRIGLGYFTIRYNRFIDNHVGIIAFTNANASAATPALIHQNIFIGGVYGVKLNNWGDDRNPNDLKFINNVFTGQSSWCMEVRGDLIANAAMLFQNNICVGNNDAAIGSDGGSTTASYQTSRFLAVNNLYRNIAQNRFSTIGAVETSFTTWQNTYGQDAGSANTSATIFSDADFHLTATSPARNRGRAVHGIGGATGTVIHAGPYITGTEIIGLTGAASPTLPTAPTNLRIVTGSE